MTRGTAWRAQAPRRRLRRDGGVSSIELLLYTPLLLFVIFITVQFALFYIGHQIVSSTAREAARVLRTGGSPEAAQAQASAYAQKIGNGLVTDVVIDRQAAPALVVRVEVRAKPLALVPIPQLETVSAVSEGPVEQFRPDS